jgi:PAS domain S-box-containing protein
MDEAHLTPNQQLDSTTDALLESEERFHLLVDAVTDYAIYMLDLNGYIVSWNKGAERIKGYRADEVIRQHFSIFYPAEDVQAGRPERNLQLAARDGRYEEEAWRVRKDGARFWADVVITALYDEQGQLRGFGKVTRDLTERKEAEAAREQLHEHELQLAHEREMRRLMEAAVQQRDTFLTIMAHELRTPLTALLGNAQLLLRRAQRGNLDMDRVLRNVQVIANQAERLNQLVLLQLDISRLHTGKLQISPTPLDIGELVRRIVEEIQPSLTRHTVTYAGPDTPLTIHGDALRLDQVLLNLIQNAIKYSPDGGTVRVAVARHGAMARVDVADQGIGIPQAELPYIFERFHRGANVDERQISGLGIGLYIVNELVTLHSGTIEVVSQEGQGSTFTIALPLVEP